MQSDGRGHISVNEDDHCDEGRVTELVTSGLTRMITVMEAE